MFPEIKSLAFSLTLPVLLSASAWAGPPPTIYMIGDSTMSNYKIAEGYPQRGWGQYVEELFIDGTRVENHAAAGRSTKSFQDENRWQPVVDKLKEGDWVIIQFGHNDQKEKQPELFAAAETDYKTNLTKFVNETRAKGAHPVLATSIYRMHFDAAGKLKSTAGKYPAAMREVAAEFKVPLVDLQETTGAKLTDLGLEGSKPYFLFFEPGEVKAFPDGKSDRTHLSEMGGKMVAGLFAQGLRETKCPLAEYLKPAAGK